MLVCTSCVVCMSGSMLCVLCMHVGVFVNDEAVVVIPYVIHMFWFN